MSQVPTTGKAALWSAALTGLVGWTVGRFHLSGNDLTDFDGPTGEPVNAGRPPSPELESVQQILAAFRKAVDSVPRRRRLAALRTLMEQLGGNAGPDVEVIEVDAGGVEAEWVLAPGADPDARLLYLHGGAFVCGSRQSHRRITAELSRRASAAVLAIDYRLLPEHRRIDGIVDCQHAYRFLSDHGPQGQTPAEHLFVAGDSAGGNLALMLVAWARDSGLRPPDGVVALSPSTDSTLSSPSLESNADRDVLVGPLVRTYQRLPRTLRLWLSWLGLRINPSDPLVSPLRGDLAGLPPILLHASEAEVLINDARRYTNKAQAAGSPVTLETWNHMPHVWHIFVGRLPEADEAFDRIGAFLRRCRASSSARLSDDRVRSADSATA